MTTLSYPFTQLLWKSSRFSMETILIKDGKENQAAPPIQLNAICLLADLNVSVNKPEIVDMILPLYIEGLEEGDASTAGLLRLRLLDAVSRMASIGFKKSYREAMVLRLGVTCVNYLVSALLKAELRYLKPQQNVLRIFVDR